MKTASPGLICRGLRCSWAYLLLALVNLSTANAWTVLVLGGSGFRGHLTTERLVREGHNVTVLSRGNNYWNIFEELKGRITHWKCNRTLARDYGGGPKPDESGLSQCAPLTGLIGGFDAVVDFSSKTLDELRQALKILRGRVGVYVFISSHAVYDVSKNATHDEPLILESDAARPGREVSPLERYQLKGKNQHGDSALECEEELMKQYNAGGCPFVVLRLANTLGPKENTIRYWLLHLWVRAHIALTMPLHLDETLLQMPISMTYTPDVAQAALRVIAMSRNEVCCPEKVHGEAFNLACEEAPDQRTLYNHVAEPIGLPYVETIEKETNRSIVLYPDIIRGPVSVSKAVSTLRWSPTDFGKAARSVARFYDRVMLDERKYKKERDLMYAKTKRMLGADGQRFVEWIRSYYAERRKNELYDELDDEDEDEIVMVRADPQKQKKGSKSRQRPRTGGGQTDL